MTWDPRQYQRFADQRLRPARDLLAQIPLDEVREAVDLGCGTGNVTALLKQRWPQARVTGIDQSSEMLARAKGAHSDIGWVRLDIAAWRPERPVDLIYSNAALQWLPDHRRLLPRLMARLAAGGVLAVQMPQTGHGLSGTSYAFDGNGNAQDPQPIPNQYDRLQFLTNWVEQGVAPGLSLTVTSAEGSLPMCSYPTYPRYEGGPENTASSYGCAQP